MKALSDTEPRLKHHQGNVEVLRRGLVRRPRCRTTQTGSGIRRPQRLGVDDWLLLHADQFGKSLERLGFAPRISLSSARFSSKNVSASDRIDVNQIFGPSGAGLCSPRAIARARARITSCDAMPMIIHCVPA